jgi:hypothetical protein
MTPADGNERQQRSRLREKTMPYGRIDAAASMIGT